MSDLIKRQNTNEERTSRLRDNIFEPEYDTNLDDDVLNSFYIPALSTSNNYRRMTGYFRSSALIAAAKGIAAFINNGGNMQIVTSPNFSSEDIEIINRFSNELDAEQFLSDVMVREINTALIQNEHVEALGWMLANNRLEFRVVLVKDNDGNISGNNIFHNKIGILSDGENTLVFSGSINETYSGWVENIENFDVFCDWLDQDKRIQKKIERFNIYWETGETKRSITVPFPEAVKREWVKSVPENKSDLKIFNKNAKRIKLRSYQNEAVSNWSGNGYRGIFNMATGTGKTITAISGLKKLFSEIIGNVIVVVAVPLQHLVENPWIETMESELSDSKNKLNFIRAYGDSKKWSKKADEFFEYMKFNVIDNIIFVTTYDTFSSEKFTNMIKERGGGCRRVLIADEVHNSGSDSYRNGLLEEYDFRLGLSATPARHLDEEGTSFVQNYFEKEVYSFTLERAINEINPDSGKTYLTPYNYYPIFVNLNEGEISEYKEYTAKVMNFLTREDLTPNEIKRKNMLLINRARILKNANDKINKFKELALSLKKENEIDHCLVYCSDGRDPEDGGLRTLNRIIKILNDMSIPNRRFASPESVAEREEILNQFETGERKVLVAIKCLDEGVDVPATKTAIIMASTGNPREYIQRRGRILRRHKDKEYANIYDFIVVPKENSQDSSTDESIFKGEYRRFREFADHSLNKDDNYQKINDLVNRFSMKSE